MTNFRFLFFNFNSLDRHNKVAHALAFYNKVTHALAFYNKELGGKTDKLSTVHNDINYYYYPFGC